MRRIRLLACGEQKFSELKGITEHYVRQIGRYCDFDLQVLRAVKGGDSAQILRREGEQLLRALGERDALVLLDPAGRQYDSPGLARWLSDRLDRDSRTLVWAIGGADGFDGPVRARAEEALSFSALTFPHDLFRIMALEQLYRSFSIIQGHPYHR